MKLLALPAARQGTFCALDFETATPRRDSACAMAIARVERNRVVSSWSTLIRPPEGRVDPMFTRIHGISTGDILEAPDFRTAWTTARRYLRGTRFIAAHNAAFDISVLKATAARAQVRMPSWPYLCTVRLARAAWNLRPTRLPNVAEALGLELDHHDAESDAAACAGIVTAWRRGAKPVAFSQD